MKTILFARILFGINASINLVYGISLFLQGGSFADYNYPFFLVLICSYLVYALPDIEQRKNTFFIMYTATGIEFIKFILATIILVIIGDSLFQAFILGSFLHLILFFILPFILVHRGWRAG